MTGYSNHTGNSQGNPASQIRLLMLTACHKSEILAPRWSDVDLADAKTDPCAVQLPPTPARLLEALPRRKDNPWVFPGKDRDGRFSYGGHDRVWQAVRTQAWLEDVRMHDLRHSYASTALALGESLTMSGKLLGHTQVQTTARYAHLARDSIQNAATRITGSMGHNLSGDQAPDSASLP